MSNANELYRQAVAVVQEKGRVSTAMVQRELGVDYSTAARLVEQMERKGVVSPANHVGKRVVMIERKPGDACSIRNSTREARERDYLDELEDEVRREAREGGRRRLNIDFPSSEVRQAERASNFQDRRSGTGRSNNNASRDNQRRRLNFGFLAEELRQYEQISDSKRWRSGMWLCLLSIGASWALASKGYLGTTAVLAIDVAMLIGAIVFAGLAGHAARLERREEMRSAGYSDRDIAELEYEEDRLAEIESLRMRLQIAHVKLERCDIGDTFWRPQYKAEIADIESQLRQLGA